MEELLATAEQIREAREGRRLREAWGTWLADRPWDHLVTLTFKSPVSLEGAQVMLRGWLRHLERRTRQGLSWFFALEVGSAGLLHLHGLILGTKHLSCEDLERSWRPGRAEVVQYDKRLGGTGYVSKCVPSGEADVEFRFRPPS